MIRRLLLLTGGTLAIWVVVSLPLRALLSDSDRANLYIAYLGTGLLLCLIPSLITLAWSEWSFKHSPQDQLMAMLAGTGIRMFVVLGAGWALRQLVAFYQEDAFLIWLAAAYLASLGLEIAVLLLGRTTAGQTGATSLPTGQE